MRPKGSQAELESRRFQAFFLYCQGKPLSEIAKSVGVGKRAVTNWIELGQKCGLAGLTSIPHTGNPKGWTEATLDQLRADLKRSPHVFGFCEEAWNGAIVAQHIETCFGIRYHKKYIQGFLRNHGLSEIILTPARALRD